MNTIFLSTQTKHPSPIPDMIKALGHRVFVLDKPVATQLKKAEALVIEASTATEAVNELINAALLQHKPVLVLHEKVTSTTVLFGSNRLITIKSYDSSEPDKLEHELKSFLNSVGKKRLIYRFNLMLNKEINMYLMDKAKGGGFSKADYIRQLISQDMDKEE